MNRVVFNLEALEHNLTTIDDWISEHHAGWTLISKVLCGHPEVLAVLHNLGVGSFGDSRLLNLEAVRQTSPHAETWYLRPPHLSAIPSLVRLANVSLNTELATIRALDHEARLANTVHRIIIMVELGDLREGVSVGSLRSFYQQVLELPNVDILGLGASLGCLAGAIPTVDNIGQLLICREFLELRFGRPLPLVSVGSSSALPLLCTGRRPREVNHFRVGESVFLGTNLIDGGTLPGLRNDVVTVEGEITEIREKDLVASTHSSSITPFSRIESDSTCQPHQRGYRALLALGQLDTDVTGLIPLDPCHSISGASSDITVVNLGPDPGELRVGNSIRFRPSYSALLRLMNDRYVPKFLSGGHTPRAADQQVHSRLRALGSSIRQETLAS